ncbi:MAG TPA: PSD1 and planctomycete cytochrome C domain-containing protein [Terriglobia bacterium]
MKTKLQLAVFLSLAAVSSLAAQTTPASSPDFFEAKIRPVLIKNCYTCHTGSQMGGLRLDSQEAVMKGGNRGPVVVPGKAAGSLLVTAIQQTDPSLKMPLGGKLTDAEISDFTAWIDAGAVWPKNAATAAANDGKYIVYPEQKEFWSLVSLKTTKVPAVKDVKWPKTDLDHFVLARLEKDGLKPVAPASKRDLIRRASLDLTGLPPTYEEIQAFEKDTSANAFAKVVDRLLASPQYGERWGRVWLDVARYGEDDYRSLNPNPKGYRPYPNAYAYRDWVIQAFNDDMPFDKFVKAQIAGDLVDPQDRPKMLAGTGFLGLGPWYYDNGAFEITRADERHDRVDAVTRGFLGLTVGCARCHNHKYDPIPQTDYYSLAGVFYNTIYEEYPGAPKKIVDEYAKLEDELDKEQKILQEATTASTDTLSRSLVYQTSNYLMGVWDVTQTGTAKKEIAQVVEQRKLDYELLDRWIKYMAKPTTKYKNKDAWQAMIKKGGTQQDAKRLADKFQEEVVAAMLEKNDIDGENKVIQAKDLDGTKPKKRTDKPSNFMSFKDFNPGSWLRLKSLPDEQNNFWTEIFQRELKDEEDPNAMPMNGRQGNPGVLLFRGWGLESRIGEEAQARIKNIQSDVDAVKKKMEVHYPFIHGVRDSEKPEDIPVAFRGDPNNPTGKPVPRHFLSLLSEGDPKPFTQGSGRLELAEAISKQPLALRVFVNRIWKGHFGTGIVDTPSNFGTAGERPTNPELLEYMANYFVSHGTSVKALQREIMLSSVYQLSTADNAEDFAKDSGNRLYWRAEKKRLDAEELRDGVLFTAGNLDNAMGGPSADLTPANLRRTVYGKVSRYKLDEYLQLFDFPSPSISAEKRFVTTVPLQRLFLMNSDFMQIEAEELAKRVANETDNRARIKRAYEYVYGRDATEEEIGLGLNYLRSEPLTEYDEGKTRAPAPGAGGRRGGRGGAQGQAKGPAGSAGKAAAQAKSADGDDKPAETAALAAADKPEGAKPATEAAKPAPAAEAAAEPTAEPTAEPADGAVADTATADAGGDGAAPAQPMGMGMMGGMGRRGGVAATPEVKYDVSVWGRYTKVLFSSSEFLFIN